MADPEEKGVGTGFRAGETPEERRERMRALALKSNEARKRNKAERDAAAAPGSGSTAGTDERDRALALREARRLLKADKTPDAVKAQLIRTLAGVEDDKKVGKPPSIEALRALPSDDLEAIVLAHL